ncbi:MAG: hypothetical protein Q8O26_06180 [Phreatobacter sp.]|nr:hypothetical protein [Phreatobacter sp.]MDP2801455.1 hypothetical protein [Phreatobacter sp.]
MSSSIPLGRIGTTEDVAEACSYFVSPTARSSTAGAWGSPFPADAPALT